MPRSIGGSCHRRFPQQLWQADEVAGRGREGEGHVDALAAAHADAAQHPELLAPAEALLDALADALAHRVAGMARRAPVEGGAPLGGVAGDVERDVQGSQLVHEVLGVIPLVGPERDAVRPVGSFLDHGEGRGALGVAVRLRDAAIDDQPVAVLHEGVPHEAQPGFPAPPLAVEPGFGVQRISQITDEVRKTEKEIVAWCRADAPSRRLITIPGVGPITASAISASVPDPALFRSGRQFAAWLGLTPKPHSSGGKKRLGRISKQGDGSIRRLLVIGATSMLRRAREDNPGRAWAKQLLERKPARVVSVALANKTARIAWAVLARGEEFKAAAAV